jgi:hypothetical protein
MTIQRRLPKQAEADCLAAFFTTNRMIEDSSLPVLTADENETAHKPQPHPRHRRPSSFFSPHRPPPHLPSGTLRRRNTFSRYSANGVGGDGAVDYASLANSLPLRTSSMLHEQEHQNMNRQNQNRLPSHHHGRTLQPSPSCARAVLLNQESASGAGGGSGIPHLPLPFAVRSKTSRHSIGLY